MPKIEPIPELILIQKDKKDVVRKLIVRTATMKFETESSKFSLKVLGIIQGGGEQCMRATEFMRGMIHECGHDHEDDLINDKNANDFDHNQDLLLA